MHMCMRMSLPRRGLSWPCAVVGLWVHVLLSSGPYCKACSWRSFNLSFKLFWDWSCNFGLWDILLFQDPCFCESHTWHCGSILRGKRDILVARKGSKGNMGFSLGRFWLSAVIYGGIIMLNKATCMFSAFRKVEWECSMHMPLIFASGCRWLIIGIYWRVYYAWGSFRPLSGHTGYYPLSLVDYFREDMLCISIIDA